MKIGIIGTGAFGLAMATVLSKNKKNQIYMWSESDEKIADYEKTGRLEKILPGVDLPKMVITNSFEEVISGSELVLIMVAAHYLSSTMPNISKYLKRGQVVCIGTKGIENNTCSFLYDIVHEYFKSKNIAVISGPSFAIDVARGEPIGLSVASKSVRAIEVISAAYKGSGVKLRSTNDIIGVQICGSIKNVIALSSGMMAGLGYSDSAQAFLITEALNDIKWLIKALGGNPKTILSFAGVGDLLLTCTSVKSRNFSFGKLVGSGASKEEIDKYLSVTTVEGYYTLKSIYKLVRKRKIKMPIVNLINEIVMNGKDPKLLVDFLYNKK